MKRLEIPASNNTPHIILDVDMNTFLIEGKSFPEDSKEFYRPVIEWMDEFKASGSKSIKICFNLFYLSSSSIISVKQFLMKAVDLNTSGAAITIEWAYDEDDDDIKKTGEDYQKLTKLNFEYKINE
jgi:SiaC family regulatory phosphoprotein